LRLDGNPLIRNLNWTQLLILLLLFQSIFAVFFWFAWRKQEALWPGQKMPFWRFLSYRLNKGLALKFHGTHLRTELIYAGMLLVWFLTFAHLLAGLITTSPLLGGPSFIDVFRSLGVDNWRTAQNFTVLINIAGALILAHWPLYARYWTYQRNASETRQA